MNKFAKKLLKYITISYAGMYAFNKFIEESITPQLPSKNNITYYWKDMNIQYRVKGEKNTSTPLLLIHNLYPTSSKEEWYRIDDKLSKKYKIYELDLPGCGQSDKPNCTYVNYMYVQLVQDFIKEIIKEKTNICASALSSSFTIMAARMNPDSIDKIIIINPTSMEELVAPVTKLNQLKKRFLNIPTIGEFIYNCRMTKTAITDDYKYVYFYHHRNVSSKITDIAYFNAHYKKSSGRHLLGSILGNYTNINIIHALPFIQNEIHLIGSGEYRNIMSEYKKYNSKIQIDYISNCRLLPQLEIPETIENKIVSIL